MRPPKSTSLAIVAPPPVLYLGTLLFGLGIHLLSPLRIFAGTHANFWLGGILLSASAAFARWAFTAMRRAGTTASPRESSEALVTDGPFRFSRNPIYLAMTGLFAGLGFALNSIWLFALLPFLLLLMDWGVIRREETYLSEKFGTDYAAYCAQVRRWL